MVSARSTVSMARTTPAQKPRGEQSTIFRGGLAGILGNSGPNHPSPAGRERSMGRNGDFAKERFRERRFPLRRFPKGLGTAFGRCQGRASKPLRSPPGTAYIGRNSRLYRRKYRLRLKNRWAKRKGDLP